MLTDRGWYDDKDGRTGVTNEAAPARHSPPLRVETVGQPVALSSLARLLWDLHTRPAPLHLVTHEPRRDPVPAVEQGPV